jgi:hypothetical protein
MKPKRSTRNILIQGAIILISYTVMLNSFLAFMALPLAIAMAVVMVLANVGTNLLANAIQETLPLRGPKTATTAPALPSSEARLRLIESMRANALLTYQLGEEEDSSNERAARIDLSLRTAPWAVHHPSEVSRDHLPDRARDLAVGTSISEVFARTKGGLLILGEPGSGKTTLMLELAREGLNRAEQDPSTPVPVVFLAASWVRRPSRLNTGLNSWLIAELRRLYEISREEAEAWIESEKLLVMLDGLDEVASAQRPAFFEALRKYRQEYIATGLVVCSRTAEYRSLIEAPPARVQPLKSNAAQVPHQRLKASKPKRLPSEPLHLRHAIAVQRLVLAQVTSYLEKWGPVPLAVWKAIEGNSKRHDLLYTPLILNILVATYYNESLAHIEKVGMPRTIRQLWDAYVEKMLHPEIDAVAATTMPIQEMRAWLAWLARQLVGHNQTVFYIEHLQPDWLSTSDRWLDKVRVRLVVGLGGGPIAGLAGATAVTLIVWLVVVTLRMLRTGSLVFLWQNFVFGALVGLVFGALVSMSTKEPQAVSDCIKPTEIVIPSLAGLWRGIYKYMVLGLRIGGILLAAMLGVSVCGFLLTRSSPEGDLIYLIGGVVLTVLVCLIAGLGIGGVYWLFNGRLVEGLSTHVLADDKRERPNQGIWQSARNGLIFALVGGLGPGVVIWLIGILSSAPNDPTSAYYTLVYVLVATLFAGLYFGLSHGWAACIQHLTLRLLLWRTGVLPLNLVRFLNYGTARIVLRRVGGGYMFIHQLLLEYFAASEAPGLSTYPIARTNLGLRKWKAYKVPLHDIPG